MEAGGGERNRARASVLSGAWSGASASVSYFNQNPSQQGANASVSAGGTENQTYLGDNPLTPIYYTLSTTGSIAAAAGADPAHLLQVTASDYAPDPGVMLSPVINGATASATWSNDSVTVTNASGSSLPNIIQLNFALTLNAPGEENPFFTVTYNGKTVDYSQLGSPWSTSGYETFHIDLPVDASGQSGPFSVGLQLYAPLVGVGTPVSYSGLSGNIALTSVTLPDGTPLASLGDSISFASGLSAPTTVPEPGTLVAWGVAFAATALQAVRRYRSMPS